MNTIQIDFNPYLILGLENSPNIPLSVIKKKFYQLSLRYHPDKIQSDDSLDKYQQIITAYNILRNDKYRKNYHQQYPLDHYHLKTKLSYQQSKNETKYKNQFDSKEFNQDFLKNISDQDKNNIDLFIAMNMTPSDIDDQFRYLHPETKFENNYIENKRSYDDFQQQIEILEDKRRLELNDLHPTKILTKYDPWDFNNQFNVNKNKLYHIIKYEEPVEYNNFTSRFLLDDVKFTREYELPNNPNDYIYSKEYHNDYIVKPIPEQDFMDLLETLKKDRNSFKI